MTPLLLVFFGWAICCSPLEAIESVLIAGRTCEVESNERFVLRGVRRKISAARGLLAVEV